MGKQMVEILTKLLSMVMVKFLKVPFAKIFTELEQLKFMDNWPQVL